MAKDWMRFYYMEPQPELFVEEVKKLAKAGALTKPECAFPMVIFLSRVIAANASMVELWFDALSDLAPDDLQSLRAAAWLSRAPEARAYLIARGLSPTHVPEQPEILEMKIDEHPIILDALWAHYFATGDHQAVRRIVSALDYMSDLGAANAYATTKKTEADKARALRDGIFQAASWSLESLMKEHTPLKEFCAELVRSGDTTPNERCALAIILSKLEPTIWHVKIDPKTSTASIAWTDPAQTT